MTPSSGKAKGRVLQYWVAKKIAELFNIEFESNNDLCPVKSRAMGQHGVDVYITDAKLAELFPLDVEAKNTEKVPVYSFITQAKANAKKEDSWLVIHKKNRSRPIAILDASKFFEIYAELLKHKGMS